MLAALRLHNETCRKLLRDFGGYEAQTEGDASMLAFPDPVSAVNYCVAAQVALLKVDWPQALLKQPGAQEEWCVPRLFFSFSHISFPHTSAQTPYFLC